MSILLVLAAVAMLVLGATREADATARSPRELVAAVKAAGWRAALKVAGGSIVLVALIAGCAAGLVLTVTAKVVYGLAIALAAIAWHLCALTAETPQHEPYAMPAGETA